MARQFWTVTVKVLPGLRRKVVQRVRARSDEEARIKAAFWLCEQDDVESYVIVRVSCRAIGYLWVAASAKARSPLGKRRRAVRRAA